MDKNKNASLRKRFLQINFEPGAHWSKITTYIR